MNGIMILTIIANDIMYIVRASGIKRLFVLPISISFASESNLFDVKNNVNKTEIHVPMIPKSNVEVSLMILIISSCCERDICDPNLTQIYRIPPNGRHNNIFLTVKSFSKDFIFIAFESL